MKIGPKSQILAPLRFSYQFSLHYLKYVNLIPKFLTFQFDHLILKNISIMFILFN